MATEAFSGGKKMEAYLARLSRKVSEPATLQVGFFENATYPHGGPPVAMVMAIHEFGAPGARFPIPARGYFRTMIAHKSPEWGPGLGKNLKANGYDARRSLESLGQVIGEQLQQSIIDVNNPPLSEVTLMLRMMKSKGGPNFVVGLKTVFQAIGRVKAGERATGVSTKPLDETGHAIRSVDHRVKT